MMNSKTPAEITAYANTLWSRLTDNEKHGVRFGMFPYQAMQVAEKDGFSGRGLSVALMDVASKNGGMRA